MPEFTVLAVLSVVAVVAAEMAWFRTGLFRRTQFWIAYAIIVFFECLVDGWLTKLSAPIVLYRPAAISGARWPWDIPVEDFGFAFAMITLTLALWVRVLRGRAPEPSPAARGARS